MKKIKVSAGIVIDDNKVLLTRRAPREKHGGGWEFPGGKIELGETPQECLARELKEELNIEVSVGEHCKTVFHDYGDIIVELIAFYCEVSNGHPIMSVHDRYVWICTQDLLQYDLLPADIPIAHKVQKDTKSGKPPAPGFSA